MPPPIIIAPPVHRVGSRREIPEKCFAESKIYTEKSDYCRQFFISPGDQQAFSIFMSIVFAILLGIIIWIGWLFYQMYQFDKDEENFRNSGRIK